MKAILVFMLMAALVAADNLVSISGKEGLLPFRAPAGLVTSQSVKIANGYDGTNLTNSLYDVSFVVHENSNNVAISYPTGSSAPVGVILAGAAGWGQFNVLASQPGRYGIAITARYRVDNSAQWSFTTKFFFLWVGQAADDDDDDKKRNVQSESDVHDFSERAGDDLEITPDNYFASAGVTSWNQFNIIAGDNNLNNITWTVTPNDLGVGITYSSGVNYIAFLQKNTTLNTNIAVVGNAGTYSLNCSVRYRKAQNPTFRNYWIVYPLYIDGSGTATLRLGAEKVMGSNVEGVQNNYVRADVALAIGIAGVALVAVVAVVAAMVVLKKKNDSISV